MKGWGFDIEADNLYLLSKKIWYIRLKSCDGTRELSLFPFRDGKDSTKQKLLKWIDSFEDGEEVVGWNTLGYDLWMLWKFFDIKPKVGKNGKDFLGDKQVQFVDGFVLSMFLHPNSPKHSLEYVSGGEENEDGKINYRNSLIRAGAMQDSDPKGHEFSFWHELMIPYCDRDTNSAIREVKKLWKEAQALYSEWVHPSFRQMQKDYWLYSAQAYTGVKFHTERAKALQAHIQEKMQILKDEVDPLLPKRELKTAEQALYKMPAKPYTKAGDLSANMQKWLDKHQAKLIDGIIYAYGLSATLEANAVFPVKLPMEIDDSVEMKDYFIQHGWEPSEDHWNFKKGPDGKNIRDEKGKFVKTTPKINHAGQLCPNLLKLNGEIPAKVVKFLSYRNRLGVVTGWLNNWRITFDGRLSAEISGYAPTSRVKHKTVVNCPKADPKVLLGSEMRDLFVVDEGNWYAGTDAAALENRTLSHYTFKYDGGAFARMQTEGDPHCYSEDTEILTVKGWKTFGELTYNDKVAQYDKGIISFVKPSAIIWQDYEGEMVSVKTGKLDFLVTPNHRVLVEQYRSKSQSVVLASEITNKNSDLRIPINGYVEQDGLCISDESIQLAVAIQADSYDTGYSYRFEFVKERKCLRLEKILKGLAVRYSVSFGTSKISGKPTTRFTVSKSQLQDTQVILESRIFRDSVYSLNYKQMKVLINEVQYWDGTLTDKGDIILDTTCKHTRDTFATISTLCGVKVSCSEYMNKSGNLGNCDIYRVYFSTSRGVQGCGLLNADISRVSYKGKIGCVSVPSTFVVVKRGNKICVSGNTFNAFAFFPHLHKEFDINNPENKEDPKFKTWRNKAKTGAYLLAFGGGAPKLASSLGLSKVDGQKAFDNYWEKNKGLGALKKAVESYFETTGKKKHIPAIDGRLVSVRGKNVLLSCLGQGLGAISMSYAACLMDTWLGDMYLDDLGRPYYLVNGKKVKRISMVHDEYSWECEEGSQDWVKEHSVKAIVKAGEFLKLSLPLAGEGKIAFNGSWKDVH